MSFRADMIAQRRTEPSAVAVRQATGSAAFGCGTPLAIIVAETRQVLQPPY